MRLVLFEPDIPQNCGTILRLAACFGVPVEIIEPCGFVFDDRRLRRAGLDYLDRVELTRHSSWSRFLDSRERGPGDGKAGGGQAGGGQAGGGEAGDGGRLLLLTTRAAQSYTDFAFRADDSLLLGRESAGAPAEVHSAATARLAIPLRPGLRSLNVAVAAAMVLGEALRQTGGFPSLIQHPNPDSDRQATDGQSTAGDLDGPA